MTVMPDHRVVNKGNCRKWNTYLNIYCRVKLP
jgi:hypothetical protein